MKIQDERRQLYSQALDRALQTAVGRFTGGISPAALKLAFYDWLLHLRIHPAKQIELIELYQRMMWQLFSLSINQFQKDDMPTYYDAQPKDKRFSNCLWNQPPYYLMSQIFLAIQNWWHDAATKVRGVSCHHEQVVDFILRQTLDIFSPANFPLTNPEIQKITIEQKGKNFIKGYENFLEDLRRYHARLPPVGAENFVLGKNIAVTPGKVIYRNNLIELIQYQPMTSEVYAEPILITPAWIMKYYILDLSPKHSLVKYLIEKGHTVFMISWKNPKKSDYDLGMNDYLKLGIFSALDVISHVVPQQKIHLLGYCLGGTLASIAAAALAPDNNAVLASLTLLAAQTDFTESGELDLFIDESQIAFLETMMLVKGYLDPRQMTRTFQLLRSNDLIWSRIIHEYLIGERKPLTDLMAWNADTTRLPYRMHSEYLRHLFLHNQLAEGKYLVNDKSVVLNDINIPIFAVATEKDHISPWRSVFKIKLLTDTDVTFTLTSGGHNVGIVSIPTTKIKRYYRSSTLKENDRYIGPNDWYENIKPKSGSWWPALEKFLEKKSSKNKMAAPHMGAAQEGFAPLEDAPGSYVFEK
jgi:poly[(R)-3-hydroxyalkanoate] polymerase subunit PhaC